MTISIWRYSHLTLAISSALFITIAAVTGAILALEPINNQLKGYQTVNLATVSVAETIDVLQQNYQEVVNLEVDENNFIATTVITKEGNSETFYVHPKTGEKIGEIIQKKPIFEFATNLHRSLFLKSTGRFLVGFFSFLLFLIAITGIILIAKRQGGFLKIFSKVVKEDFNQYYHVVLGRWFLIPILIITITGVYLSLERFSLLPKDTNAHKESAKSTSAPKLNITDFKIFKNTALSDVQKLEFPFSNDEEDYFFLKLRNKEFAIHQFSGQIISEKQENLVAILSNYSLFLHTGKGSVIWSFILLISCFSILFFMYSGFFMTLQRRKKTKGFINLYTKDEAEFIILYGSETGGVLKFATAFYSALTIENKIVFIDELNNYTTYKKAKHLLVFTATYGDGEAPANANSFLKKLHRVQLHNQINFSVLGFGSTKYPEFCKFATQIQNSLQLHKNFTPILSLFKVNNQSLIDFEEWLLQWKNYYDIPLEIDKKALQISEEKIDFKVIATTNVNVDDTFLITLKPTEKIKFSSGDLLKITPNGEDTPRFYSIAKVGKHILLSVKKHQFGLCSNFLKKLAIGAIFEASISQNKSFHFPKKVKEVWLIANGTGIAPFLGIIDTQQHAKIRLFWGGKTKESLKIYKPFIDKALQKGYLNQFETALSQETDKKIYVQDLILQQEKEIANFLENGNVVMICGSLAMQKGVENELQKIAENLLKTSIERLKEKNQILTDCY